MRSRRLQRQVELEESRRGPPQPSLQVQAVLLLLPTESRNRRANRHRQQPGTEKKGELYSSPSYSPKTRLLAPFLPYSGQGKQ